MLVALSLHVVPAGAATQVGFKAHSYAGFSAESTGGAITGQKPESKLWFHDGSWWAAMLSPAAGGAHRIHRLEGTSWTDTGTLIDPRPATKEDVLSLGSTLYVVSRSNNGTPNRLRRFTYANGSYTLDSGFPVDVPGTSMETTTLARDSVGTLWVSYEQNNSIRVAHTTGSDTSWGAPFILPVAPATGVKDDDISSVIAFNDAAGPAIGVLWSNQNTQNDYFAVHRDGAGDGAWSVETALSGPLEADDHINVKTFEGRIFAVVKTSRATTADILIRLLVRSPDGNWSTHPVANTAPSGNTRPITMLQIDPVANDLFVFMTKDESTSAEGIEYEKTSVDRIDFSGAPLPFIRGPNAEQINDATSMKANATRASGVVVLASDGSNYWWNQVGNEPPSGDEIAFRAASSTNAVSRTLTIPVPAATQAGDVLIASVEVEATPSITAPAGWTNVRQTTVRTTPKMRKRTYLRVAGASEPSSYTWTFGSSRSAAGGIAAFSGVDQANPIVASGEKANGTASTSITAPSITTTVPNSMLVGLFGIRADTTIAPPTNMAEAWDDASVRVTSETAHELVAATGSTGARVATASTAGVSIGHLVALRPAP